jgi:hypothetical protein
MLVVRGNANRKYQYRTLGQKLEGGEGDWWVEFVKCVQQCTVERRTWVRVY